jgi:hypothetical protein
MANESRSFVWTKVALVKQASEDFKFLVLGVIRSGGEETTSWAWMFH